MSTIMRYYYREYNYEMQNTSKGYRWIVKYLPLLLISARNQLKICKKLDYTSTQKLILVRISFIFESITWSNKLQQPSDFVEKKKNVFQ